MKWYKQNLDDMIGENRILEKFLLFPKTIGTETRWLERTKYKQKVVLVTHRITHERYGDWRDWEWID